MENPKSVCTSDVGNTFSQWGRGDCYGNELHTKKGELVYEYELSRREGLRREKEENPQIFGMSLPATVKERSGNRIRVQFDIDPVYEVAEKNKYFTYAIESSSFYCMPEEGSRVQVYFPEHEEQSAIAVHAISSESGGASASKNPAQKQFSDPSGNAMDMAEATLDFVADAEGQPHYIWIKRVSVFERYGYQYTTI